MKKEDLLGQVFDKLTVIAEAPRRNNRTYWMCRCECGTELEILASNLKRGNTKSCGLCGNGGKKLDLTGQRFGNLVALKISDRTTAESGTYWLCRCDCGKEISVRINHLRSGKVFCCGCKTWNKPNEYRVEGDTVYVTLNGKHSDKTMICDLDDWERLKAHTWHIMGDGYASTSNNDGELMYREFHRNVIEPKDGLFVDHINRNTLDNRKCNLREATQHANTTNRKKPCTNTSGYKGIKKRENGKWQAIIGINGKTISLGTYSKLEDAIEARKRGEEKYFQPLFERTN